MAEPEGSDAEFRARLISALGRDAVLTELADRTAYASDALYDAPPPCAVTLPRTTEQTATIVRIAAEFGRPVVARGAGTGLVGGAAPAEHAVVIAFTRMNRILAIDPIARRAAVQPGTITLDLSYAAAPFGLFYAPDPASERISTIGGNLATNASGPHAFAYGTTSEQVLGLVYVDAAGNVQETSADDGRIDIAGAFAGSEGTLGIITELALRLRRSPESIRVATAAFFDYESAIEASMSIREHCSAVVALEFLDEAALAILASIAASPYPEDARAIVLMEFAGLTDDTNESLEQAEVLVRRYGAQSWMTAQSADEAQRLWAGRHAIRTAVLERAEDIAIHDIVVPRSRMTRAVKAVQKIALASGLRIAVVGHLGDGALHPIILFSRKNLDEAEAAENAGTAILEMAINLGGGPGEYGIGIERRDYTYSRHTLARQAAMQTLREAFDPFGILNPEKILPAALPVAAA